MSKALIEMMSNDGAEAKIATQRKTRPARGLLGRFSDQQPTAPPTIQHIVIISHMSIAHLSILSGKGIQKQLTYDEANSMEGCFIPLRRKSSLHANWTAVFAVPVKPKAYD